MSVSHGRPSVSAFREDVESNRVLLFSGLGPTLQVKMTSTPKGGWECEVPIKTSNFVALEHEFFKLNQFVRKTSAGLDSEEDPRNFFLGGA